MATQTRAYGEWTSPITAAEVAQAQVGLSFPTADANGVWWQESRPAEGGRLAIICQPAGGSSRYTLPMPWNARNRVHEYGGKSYLTLPGGFLFANFGDQRLYRCQLTEPDGPPEPLTPAPTDTVADRYADYIVSPAGDEVWCVRERHADGKVRRAIVAIPLDGSAAEDPGAVRILVTGSSDFYAYPSPSPDGTRLAWISWDHPRMPWDGSELRITALGTDPGEYQVLMGGDSESVVATVWRDDQSLYVISDRSDWWNLYLVDLAGSSPQALCPREEEFAAPLWQLGMKPYVVLADGRIATVHGTGEPRLGVLDPGTGQLTDLDLPYSLFSLSLSVAGQTVVMVAGGPAQPSAVVAVDVPATGSAAQAREVSRSASELPDPAYLPVPHAARLTGPSGSVVHALVYPPSNPDFRGPDGERPPYIVWVHGGPTSHVSPRLDLEKAFFTSRGIGIVDVNYGGSSGYGRAYRERLRGQWGVVDVADVMSAALALAETGEADGKRLGIRGGSAGGWTALAAVTSGVGLARQVRGDGSGGVFAAAASYFGVSDLREFAEQTHDFESRYLDGLIGPMPGSEALYAERAPVGHVSDATCPVLLLQGLDDPIVPPAQAESIAADLAARGIPHAYIAFPGESHGFRKAENIVTSLEAELSFYGEIMGFVPPGVPPVDLEGPDRQ